MLVNNCGNCPFMVLNMDFNAIGYDTLCYCNLLRHNNVFDDLIVSYNSYEFQDAEVPELEIVLPNCPLLKEEINIKYEEKRTS